MKGWEVEELGKLAPVMASKTAPAEDEVWLLNLDKVESNTGTILDYLYVPVDSVGTSTCRFDTTNVLYSKLRPYLNKVVMPEQDGYATSEMLPLKPDPDRLTREYLTIFLRSPQFVEYISSKVSGAKMPRANTNALMQTRIPLPSISEQQRVFSETSKILGSIYIKKQQIEQLDLLIKSQFIEMFGDPVQNEKGWPLTTVGGVAEIKIGPFGSLLHKEDYIENGHALVNPSHIVDGKISVDNKLTISDEKYEELSTYKLQSGDVVLGRRGEMGRCAVVYEDGLLCGTGSMIIRPGQLIKPYFLQNILSNPTYKKTIEDKAVGVTMMNLNVPIVSGLQIPLLPIKLQEQFITFMEQVDKSKFALSMVLNQLQLLFEARMQHYFGDFNS